MAVTTSGGVLVKAQDGHITRGGEFQKRAAFVPEYTLPEGTKGLAAGKAGIVVFGDGEPPTLPTGVSYQRVQHPDGTTALTDVLSYDLYGGKIYAVCEFADGGRYHFYDGVRIPDWFDGRARAAIRVTGGTGTDTLDTLLVDGVSIITSAVTWTTSNSATAQLIADEINATTSSPDYTATASGEYVNIIAADAGANANGRGVTYTVTGTLTFDIASGSLSLSDGADPTPAASASGSFEITGGTSSPGVNKVSDVTVNGVSIISGAVNWATSHTSTAAAVASAINSYVSSPDYTATSSGAVVTITASATGSAINGASVAVTVGGNVTVGNIQAMSGGADSEATFAPGTYVKTIGSRVHSVSGPNEHFSGIGQPTKWTTDTTGAGFIDMSTQASGAEALTALAKYQQFVAVFAERTVQIWYYDSDPTLNEQKQVLNNTGTASPRSVTQFGDNDLFYLDESGARSLRARDASNAAATTDIGVPVDTLIVEKLRTLTDAQRKKIIGLIEPGDGRFWLIMLDTIFVFSFFQGAKISAWTTYTPSTNDGTTVTSFEVEDACVYRRKVYLRSGDTIYVYGGLDTDLEYDSTEAEAWLPYVDADDPAAEKKWLGVDVAAEGVWVLRAAMTPTDESASDEIATITETTYGHARVPTAGVSSHLSLRLKSSGSGAAKIGSVILHFDKADSK